jgi:hypothetical protein
MGVHVSFVQSVKLDKWSQENILKMLVGGNAKAKAFFRQHGYDGKMDVDAKQRYGGAAGTRYKKKIAADASNAQIVHDCLHALFPNEEHQPEDDFFSSMGATAAPAATQQQSIGERRAAAAAAKAEALAAAAQRKQEAELAAEEAAKERVAAAAAAMTADDDAGFDIAAKPKMKIRMGAKPKPGAMPAAAAAQQYPCRRCCAACKIALHLRVPSNVEEYIGAPCTDNCIFIKILTPPHDWYASPGVKKLGGKKLGGAKIAKTSATTDWDNTDAALTANEPDAAPVDDFTSEADGLGQLTGKSRALVLRCKKQRRRVSL